MVENSRSSESLQSEVARLTSTLASALKEVAHLKEENRRLRKLMLTRPVNSAPSSSRKRVRDEPTSVKHVKRLRPVLCVIQSTPGPVIDSSNSEVQTVSAQANTSKSRSGGTVSTSKETLQRKAEDRRKAMVQLVKEFSENCRPVYQSHLEQERKERKHGKSCEEPGKKNIRFLR